MANSDLGYEWLVKNLDPNLQVLSVGKPPKELEKIVCHTHDIGDALPPLGYPIAFTDLEVTGIQGAATAYLSTTTDGELLATCKDISNYMADNRFNQMWQVAKIYAISGRHFVKLQKTNSYSVCK